MNAEPLRGHHHGGRALAAGVHGERRTGSTAPTIYQKATGKVPENATQTIKTKDGKIDDTYGTINDACQTLTMFHDIGQRVGKYLNNANWVNTVNTSATSTNRGSGPYSSLHDRQVLSRRQLAAPGVRLHHSGTTGLWKPITPLEDVDGQLTQPSEAAAST